MNKPLTGSEQRLRDIQDALAEKVAAERRPFGHSKENISQATPKIRVKSVKGREQRLREIQNALAGLEAVSKTTSSSTTVSVSTLPTAKRPSESSPPPPAAKRRRLQSSHEAVAIVLPTSIPTPAPTTIQPTNHASASSNTFEQRPEELYKKVHHRAVETPQLRDADSHIHEFFAKYPDFSYNPRTSATDEFRRMCGFLRWKHSKEVGCVKVEDDWGYKDARQSFSDAMAQEFNYIYGTDLEDINSWKNLCKALRIIPIPKGLEECQDAVAATHVNIVDLVETGITGKPVKLFKSEVELSVYTLSKRKFFPRDNAYAGGLLRFLLRHILDP